MKKILLILFLALSFSLSAQQHFIGIKGGLLSTNAKYYGDNYSYYELTSNLNSFSAGLTYDFVFKFNFILGIELNYNEKGFTNGTDIIGLHMGDIYKYELKSKYFSLPIKIGYQIGNKAFFNIYTGLIGSWQYEGDIKQYLNGEELYKPLNANIYDGTKLEAAAFLEMGVGYKFDIGIRTYITYLYQHSFTNIPFYRASDDMYFYGMSVSVGVQYELFKN